MDANGRLHMPGFVGDTFEETGVLQEREAMKREALKAAGNRKQRRAQEAMDRRASKTKAGETV